MNGRPFTSDDVAILRRMASSGYSDGEIARHLGRARRHICEKRRALGIERGLCPAMIAMLARVNMRRRMAA